VVETSPERVVCLIVRTVLRTKVWPWFVIAAVLLFIGAVILHGTPQACFNSAAALTFLGACMRKVGLAVRDNEVAKDMVGRRGGGSAGYTGWLAEGPEERRKKP
jgi:hypothetical protein